MSLAHRITWRLVVGIVAAIAVWQLLAAAADNPLLAPGPWHLVRDSYPSFATFSDGHGNDYVEATKVLVWHAGQTTLRALLGLSTGATGGICLGLGIYVFTRNHNGMRFFLDAGVNVPLFSLVPLFVYWFSGREVGVVLYVAFAVFVLMATAAYEATRNIPIKYLWLASLAGARPATALRTVILPATLPELFLSLRWVVGLVWAFTLGAEYLSSGSAGCGFLVYQSYLYADVGKLIVLAGVYAILGVTGLRVFDSVALLIFPIHYKRNNVRFRS